jgi:hypothetical protein
MSDCTLCFQMKQIKIVVGDTSFCEDCVRMLITTHPITQSRYLKVERIPTLKVANLPIAPTLTEKKKIISKAVKVSIIPENLPKSDCDKLFFKRSSIMKSFTDGMVTLIKPDNSSLTIQEWHKLNKELKDDLKSNPSKYYKCTAETVRNLTTDSDVIVWIPQTRNIEVSVRNSAPEKQPTSDYDKTFFKRSSIMRDFTSNKITFVKLDDSALTIQEWHKLNKESKEDLQANPEKYYKCTVQVIKNPFNEKEIIFHIPETRNVVREVKEILKREVQFEDQLDTSHSVDEEKIANYVLEDSLNIEKSVPTVPSFTVGEFRNLDDSEN